MNFKSKVDEQLGVLGTSTKFIIILLKIKIQYVGMKIMYDSERPYDKITPIILSEITGGAEMVQKSN